MIPGIDWSHWQDDKTGEPPNIRIAEDKGVEWHVFRAGRGMATVSPNDIDPTFRTFVSQARKPWSPYWYHESTEGTVEDQMGLYALTVYRAGEPTMPWHLNLETGRGVLPPKDEARWIRDAVDLIKDHSKRDTVILYVLRTWWDTNVDPTGIDFSDCDFRIPRYITAERPPSDPSQWEAFVNRYPDRAPILPKGIPEWDAWQFTSIGYGREFGAESENLDHNLAKPEAFARWTYVPPVETTEEMIRRVVREELAGVAGGLRDIMTEVDGHGYAIDRIQEILVRWDAGLRRYGG